MLICRNVRERVLPTFSPANPTIAKVPKPSVASGTRNHHHVRGWRRRNDGVCRAGGGNGGAGCMTLSLMGETGKSLDQDGCDVVAVAVLRRGGEQAAAPLAHRAGFTCGQVLVLPVADGADRERPHSPVQ